MNATVQHPIDTTAGETLAVPSVSRVFRIDTFACPTAHQSAFEDRLAIIHGYFDTLPGCLYNRVVAAAGENDDMVKIITIVEWRDRQALDAAKSAVGAFYAKSGFDPAVFMAERGITGVFGVFLPVERSTKSL
ncbi:MAG: antibiotic biosynthesis monooxygenase [Hydrogenophaga sp.]|nr:antibiotic biosynthesis monooxygenase [Hydrogenophaga sp.]MBW8321392.1 antibiotic biosynthesis monooxygenase [Rhizobium sp.]